MSTAAQPSSETETEALAARLPSPRAASSLRKPPLAAPRRWALWSTLLALVALLLVMLVWLAGRYESARLQADVEAGAGDAVADLRLDLSRALQNLQSLPPAPTAADLPAWTASASNLLREHRAWLRLERRADDFTLRAALDSPLRPPAFVRFTRAEARLDIAQACANARRASGPAYAASYYVPQMDGMGFEVMELCLPLATGSGYVIASFSLAELLGGLIAPRLTRAQEVSFTEADGTRLALVGAARRGGRLFTAQQLLDLPGHTLVLRLDHWRAPAALFPDVLTALVATLALSLVAVLALLGRDMRRRLAAESDLAEALAFRKAMEDSLVTGLRARDLAGRTTYVNPAFCDMVGLQPRELLGVGTPAPYWPPELAGEYEARQSVRFAGGGSMPRAGWESVFMRRDGGRFPVLIIEAPLVAAGGAQTGWMSAVIDLSEQRRAEELTRGAQERLQATARLATVGEMASLLSHELNQPLAAIASYAHGSLNLLGDEPGAGWSGGVGATSNRTDVVRALQRIAEQAERCGRVIRGVNDFVRRRDGARRAVAPAELLDAVMPLVGLQARKIGARVRLDVASGLAPALCDRTMVEQVLLNLARNAVQAMVEARAPRPVLRIEIAAAGSAHAPAPPGTSDPVSRGDAGDTGSVSADDHAMEVMHASGRAPRVESAGWLLFSVHDQGAGIAETVRNRLFTPFFTTREEGMGLGLSLCRTVVEQHGGRLWFEPVWPCGTVFRFTLPTAPSQVPAPTDARPEPASLLGAT